MVDGRQPSGWSEQRAPSAPRWCAFITRWCVNEVQGARDVLAWDLATVIATPGSDGSRSGWREGR
jgi:hypothetical protein